jgi:two-component system, chemotaxis family, chemotaxis protein CheY
MSYKLKNIRVLVIDDNMPIRMLVRSLLLDLGFGSVDVAADGEEGWKSYCLHKPDIILVDWRMDKVDGVEFTRRVRSDNTSPKSKVPVIMMTGFTNKQRVFAARDVGVTEFLIKPFTVQTLAAHLMHVIERPRDFVIAPNFVGPDRRRRKDDVDDDGKKRKTDPKKRRSKTQDDAEHKKSTKYLDLRGGVYKPPEEDKE